MEYNVHNKVTGLKAQHVKLTVVNIPSQKTTVKNTKRFCKYIT